MISDFFVTNEIIIVKDTVYSEIGIGILLQVWGQVAYFLFLPWSSVIQDRFHGGTGKTRERDQTLSDNLSLKR